MAHSAAAPHRQRLRLFEPVHQRRRSRGAICANASTAARSPNRACCASPPGSASAIWNKNCVAIGLASGFLEPLESTSIYLIQSGIARLVNLFPDNGFSDVVIDRYNAQCAFEIESIRDFIILHYCATERDDSAFWNYVRTMDIPAPLRDNIALFRDSGRFFRNAEEMFALTSWVRSDGRPAHHARSATIRSSTRCPTRRSANTWTTCAA